MFLLDINVVLALYREDHPQHTLATEWFDRLRDGHGEFTVPATVWVAVLRLATNRRVFPVTSTRAQVFAFWDALRAQPEHVVMEPGARHLALVRQTCDEADAKADLVPDAVIAAIAVEHHCEIVTFDRDFARFPSVRHRLLTT